MGGLLDHVGENCPVNSDHENQELITFLNHYSYQIARKHVSEFQRFDRIYCDGILLTWVLRVLGKNCHRKSFDMTSLAPVVFQNAVDKNLEVALVGGEEGIAKSAAGILKSRFPGLRVGFTCSGFFESSKQRQSVLRELAEASPDIVICGMGTPYQEKFLLDLVDAGWIGSGYTCGGFFHQTAKKGAEYYPSWVDRYNLRWAYRIYDEPKLFKRYSVGLVTFFYRLILDVLRK